MKTTMVAIYITQVEIMEFNSLNPGIVLNDLIIQGLIHNGKSFFDFLKGTERYKFDLGGKSVQLYDLNLIL